MSQSTTLGTGSSGATIRNYVIAAVVGVFVLAIIGMAISSYNYAVDSEATIIANHDQAKNVLGQYTPMLREALGVTRLQAKDVANVFQQSNQARYGKNGSSAEMQWIHEQNPTLDQSNYGKVINLIEAGRHDFRDAQQQQIDRVRAYRSGSQQFPRVIFLSMFGKPTPGFFDQYSKIVVSSEANQAYQTGIDDGTDVANMQ